jgi:hypothetical protein
MLSGDALLEHTDLLIGLGEKVARVLRCHRSLPTLPRPRAAGAAGFLNFSQSRVRQWPFSTAVLADGRQVMLIASAQPDRPQTDQSLKLMQDMAEGFRLAGKPPSSLDDQVRLTGIFELKGASVGMRGFTEMAASSLGNFEFDLRTFFASREE